MMSTFSNVGSLWGEGLFWLIGTVAIAALWV